MSKNLRNRLVLVLALFLACMAPAVAQTYTEGSIAGTVSTPVALWFRMRRSLFTTMAPMWMCSDSDGSGYFKAAQLPAATYTLTVNATGFAPFKEVHVIVEVGQTTEVSPHLATAGTTRMWIVTGEAPILNFESPDISTVLDITQSKTCR